jgi:outer membrane beta-barrel protein
MRLPVPVIGLLAIGLSGIFITARAAGGASPSSAATPATTAEQPAAPSKPPSTEPAPANEPIVEPQLDRRKVKVPRIPANDIEIGLFAGTYSTENFGSNIVGGLRLGYHVTEDVFVEAVYGQTKVSDQDFRQILPGGIFVSPSQTLRYYDLSFGVNVLPGEVFLGSRFAKVSALYLIAGLGTTEFADQRHLTFNAGTGFRVFLRDWVALQLDMRDHVYSVDLLGSRKTTQNLEFSGGVTFFF